MGKRGRKKQTTTNPTSLRRSSPAFRSSGFVLRADCSTVAKVAKSMMGDHPPIPPSPSLKEDNATASSAAGGSKLSKDSLSLVEARHMSKNTRRKGGIAKEEKNAR